jgi:hypothetical protein
MNNVVTWVLALAVCVGTTAALAIHYPEARGGQTPESLLAVDGAYRDGLYLGKLTAESGRQSRPPIGRWSTEMDRASFRAGYERGYSARNSQSLHANSDF